MSISERIRPGIEAAEWVCIEVGKLEASYAALKETIKRQGEPVATVGDLCIEHRAYMTRKNGYRTPTKTPLYTAVPEYKREKP